MANILANDGLAQSGIDLLEKEGFEVKNTRVAEEQLANYINKNNIEALLVRSATKVDKKLIDDCPKLKLIGRGGVGLDNIDVKYAKSKGIHVFNTPEASSESVAELVFAHLLNGVRFLHDSNRNMPLEGDSQFKQLKKSYATGIELRGKTLGIVGFGRIGQATAKMALALGLEVLFTDHNTKEATLDLTFFDGQSVSFNLKNKDLKEVLANSDFVSLHVPSQEKYLIGKKELALMKPGSGIVNTSRGGVLDEVALVEALDSGHLAFAGLDVFESEPNPEIKILMNPKISLSPHVGGSTIEAQQRIGIELAQKVIKLLK
ncbi:D-2-hydroxyacid dehydrogenase [Flagellimonas halotolerans]|uniref:D-2-hydroxyacid dehydrogenase n=1 Tax=Flagellimonas halotolerans TaxID=3112164 RepID=A0ABU6IN35_9FLAO|nr:MULTISPECIES: D-2-hydroxyacid dehydrogenase [unclassified Allomuricauda]MEC3964656.1 D-2-hydroxyacid dehydrogenase [Muricauda sp. SYSU M86414]MEC4264525.1 D-2-hydroxyacid dehydrogenase [Muricauda sp. SYSU M84420]